MSFTRHFIGLALLVGAASSLPVFSQSSGAINGSVQDSSGAVIPTAAVTAVEQQSNRRFETVSDEQGRFSFPRLAVGNYRLEASRQGFKRFTSEVIRLDADQNRQAVLIFQVGDTTETVEVTGAVSLVETIGGTIRETVDQKRITELPLNGRNALQLQLLVPGAVPSSAPNTSLGQNDAVSVNGSRGLSNNYLLDGADNNDPQLNVAALVPNPDTLEEFSILTNNYSAEYGRGSGAVVNAITRAGTQHFHGSLWEFVRNDAFDSRNFFSLIVPKLRRNQFGGAIGGPVLIPGISTKRDRTFFFTSYEGLRERRASTVSNLIVPTELERRGNFSQSSRKPMDPVTRAAFPGDIVPANRFDPAAQKFVDIFIPLPNASGGRHIYNSPFTQDRNQLVARIDHHIGPKQRIYGRYFNDRDKELNTAGLPILQSDVKFNTSNMMVNHTWTISPSLLNSLQFSYSQVDLNRGPLPVLDGLTYEKLGLNIRSDTPQYTTNWRGSVTGFWNLNQDNLVTIDRHTYQLQDSVSYFHAGHMIKFGGEFRRASSDRNTANLTDPQFTFDGRFATNAFADFILGLPSRMDQGSLRVNAVRAPAYSFFFQDDWKVRSNFSLTFGLRYEPFIPFYDANDRVSVFRAGQQSALYPTAPRGLVFYGDQGVSRGGAPLDLNNLGPRVSFAWSPAKKTSIRGAYGVFYETPAIHQLSAFASTQPFSSQVQVNQPFSFSDPYRGRINPFPYAQPTSDADRKNFAFLLPIVVGESIDEDMATGYMQQWNLSVQRETIQGIIVTGAYVGSKGTRLPIQRNINPAIFGPGATTANIDQRRIYAPNFGAVANYESGGFSTYHSMQLSLNKRFSHGYTLLANYTWSKSIDNVSTDTQGAIQDSMNLTPEKGLSDFDVRHRFVTSFLWEVPGPKAGVGRLVLGGWQVNGILTVSAGTPYNVVSGTDRALAGGGSQRPNVVGDPLLDSGRPRADLITRYFNTSAFATPALGTFGNSGRNSLTGPASYNLDSSLFKMIPIREAIRLQLRAEFFNALNHANLSNPVANMSSATVGQILTASSPRIMQFGLRLTF